MLYRFYVAVQLEDLTRRAVSLASFSPRSSLALARVESPVVTDCFLPTGVSPQTIARLLTSDFSFSGRSRHSESRIRTLFLATRAAMNA